MKKRENHQTFLIFFVGFLTFFIICSKSQTPSDDASVMVALKKNLSPFPSSLEWSDPDPCNWKHVACSEDKRVTRIQIGHQNLQGTVVSDLKKLTFLQHFELQWNNLSGPVPNLSGLSFLQVVILSNNQFTSFPTGFFVGLSSLQAVEIDYNPFSGWEIPDSIKDCSSLKNFSANEANLTGKIPNFFGFDSFPSLNSLHLAFNRLEGELPLTFSGSQIESLWVNGQKSEGKLSGRIDVLQNMTSLKEVWLHWNRFSGPMPDFSGLKDLEILSLRDNLFTGPVHVSLMSLNSLKVVNLTNNLFQGPTPKFKSSVSVDMITGLNRFCLPVPGSCDSRVNSLLSIVKPMSFPQRFAENWMGNNPCANWIGITCNNNGNVTIINFQKMNLLGTISPEFADLTSLQRLLLDGNNLTGHIPDELTTLPALEELDVSNNRIFGKIPSFRRNVIVNTNGNLEIGKNETQTFPSVSPLSNTTTSDTRSRGKKSSGSIGVIIFPVIGGVFLVTLIGLLILCLYIKKQNRFRRVQSPNMMVIHPQYSGSDNENVKVTVASRGGSSVSVGSTSETHIFPSSDIQMVEAGNMVISIQVLRNVTNNFNRDNILGQGGFGVVYKGELHDGTKIAVKRMESGVITGTGISEFQSEIAVLTKVRHRHLVSLLGYCLDGNEKLLVYEYMPQGTVSRHIFNWKEEGLKPLEWTKRLSIALDVARGVEYLHGLAQQSFIHRDLKPSNILLGDDMKAKVADFGLVRLAPDGKGSIQTRIAGTFGYLAPEYAVTGRVTTKSDVFSFGVILMELITGRKALDDKQPEESMHLVTWFKKTLNIKDAFRTAIDPTIIIVEETLTSITTVAELAGHCCAREPYQRPDMGHIVNILSSLVEKWKPMNENAEDDEEDMYGIDYDMSLPQAVKKWQAYDGRSYMETSSSSLIASSNNTQTSIPNRPYGFAESFTSTDGR